MIPSPTILRHEAGEAWAACRDEAVFRARFVEGTWAPRINAARHAGEISAEETRLAFVAVLSPIPYRRRFDRPERMSESAAIVALFDLGVACRSSDQVANRAMTDLPYVRDIAREYGIVIVDDDDDDDDVIDDIEDVAIDDEVL